MFKKIDSKIVFGKDYFLFQKDWLKTSRLIGLFFMFPGQIDLKLVPLKDWFLCFKKIDSKIVLQKEKDSGKTVFYPRKIDFNTLKGLFFMF